MSGALPPKILVKYSAAWCNPCRRMAPIVKEICSELKITLVEKDVDEMSAEEKLEAGLKSVPTYKFYVGGSLKNTFYGVMSKEEFISRLS